jgi:hypothetical protein
MATPNDWALTRRAADPATVSREICKGCGLPFDKRHVNQEYCVPDCQKSSKRARRKKRLAR